MKLIYAVNVDNFNKSSVCIEAKYTKKTFKPVTSRQTELLELVHLDLVDLKNTASIGGNRYYITFINDYSRYTKVYLFRSC